MSAECVRLREHSRLLRERSRVIRERAGVLHAACRANGKVMKTCSCGRTFRFSEWDRLRSRGRQDTPISGGELRDCPCTSTLLLTTWSPRLPGVLAPLASVTRP